MSTIRTALRFAAAIAVTTLAACADNSVTGADQQVVSAKAASTRVQISLTAPAGAPFRTAKGKAKWDSRNPELEIEAENIPAGTGVVFMLGGVQVGTGTASALRAVSLNLRGAAATASVTGKSVSVNRASDGAVIVRGSF